MLQIFYVSVAGKPNEVVFRVRVNLQVLITILFLTSKLPGIKDSQKIFFRMNGTGFIIDLLTRNGIDTVFTVPGAHVGPFLNELVVQHGVPVMFYTSLWKHDKIRERTYGRNEAGIRTN